MCDLSKLQIELFWPCVGKSILTCGKWKTPIYISQMNGPFRSAIMENIFSQNTLGLILLRLNGSWRWVLEIVYVGDKFEMLVTYFCHAVWHQHPKKVTNITVPETWNMLDLMKLYVGKSLINIKVIDWWTCF